MASFEASLAQLATIPDERLSDRARWSRGEADVRYALLFNALEREQEAVVRARIPYRGGEAARILGLAQVAYGDLRGLLVGLSEADLDRKPAEGEWSVRETMHHATRVERSYRAAVLYAVARAQGNPIRIPVERRPQPDPADTAGDGTAVAVRLGVRRSETDAELRDLREEDLGRPSVWGPLEVDVDVDVRFRLHRFASHLVEHTIQCETALERTGQRSGDARRAVRRISIARAMHERISPAEVLSKLDTDLMQSLNASAKSPGGREA